MPHLHQYPVYGCQRPGTNSYAMGGFGYGAYDGGFGQVTATNFAVVARRDTVGALRHQAAGADAAAVAMLTTGRPGRGAIDMRAAELLRRQARRVAANAPAAMARYRAANMRTSRITGDVLNRGSFAGYGQNGNGGPPEGVPIPTGSGSGLAQIAEIANEHAAEAAAAGDTERADLFREESERLRGLARAAAAAGEHGAEGRGTAAAAQEAAEMRRADQRAAAIVNGAKGGVFGRGIPWDAKTGGEKAAVVGTGASAAGGAAWMLGLL